MTYRRRFERPPRIGDPPDSLATRATLACIIVISVGIAVAWLVLVPMFQEPDENAHFDYAYQLYSVGRPYRVANATCPNPFEVTRAARYLERRSDFYGVRLLSGTSVPPGYGAAAFVRSVDRLAPPRVRRVPPAGSPAPCVMFSYPSGFYAIAATLMMAADSATHGSLIAEFFFARALGIVCLAVTLPLSFRLLRENHVSSRNALLATAAIGIFPLTSWMSACVQPDDLTFLGVTFALLMATRLRRVPADTRAALLLGTTIVLLAFVKPHYAGVLYAACVALLLSIWPRMKSISSRSLAFAVIGLAPLLALRMSWFATPVGAIHVAPNLAPSVIPPVAVSPSHAALLIAAFAAKTILENYVSGPAFHRFWNAFGWQHDSFFQIPAVDRSVEFIIGLGSLATAVVFVTNQSKVLFRIAKAAYRRSIRSATGLLCGDVVINTYAIWAGLLVVVCASSRGTWSLQGRYWLPVIVPMMAILLLKIPRAFPTRVRSRVATIAAGSMLAYSAVGAPFALAGMHARYYGPRIGPARMTVVVVGGTVLGQSAAPQSIAVHPGSAVVVSGLAFRSTDGSPLDHVIVSIDGYRQSQTRYGIAVPTGIAPMPVGFKTRISTRPLATGIHRLRLLAYFDRRHFDTWQSDVFLDAVPARLSAAR